MYTCKSFGFQVFRFYRQHVFHKAKDLPDT
uniref:Uncharacterized protein n=1 Tax=Siphoviridae sp. ctabX13 TaxID=2826389 RepID=A0A8S5LWZ5_9CAUD|nr:MAG TPA: hypothetical protein [Siphoviridae sp. ctabX13]